MKDAQGQPVCVVGMHRSGTSVVARAMNLLGVSLGDSSSLMKPASDQNPTGFWENEQIVEINKELLDRLGGTWDELPPLPENWAASEAIADLRRKASELVGRVFGDGTIWGWKDPRTSVTLPFWKLVVPGMRYILCLRNPSHVCRSLHRRDGFTPHKSSYLWKRYTLEAILNSEGADRSVVFYEDFFEDWEHEFEALSRFIHREDSSPDAETRKAFREFLQDGLWHHRDTVLDTIADPAIDHETKSLYVFLRQAFHPGRLKSQAPTDELISAYCRSMLEETTKETRHRNALRDKDSQIVSEQGQIAEMRTEMELLRIRAHSIEVERSHLTRHLDRVAQDREVLLIDAHKHIGDKAALRAQLTHRDHLIADIKASTVWRLTRPLRALAALKGRLNVGVWLNILGRIRQSPTLRLLVPFVMALSKLHRAWRLVRRKRYRITAIPDRIPVDPMVTDFDVKPTDSLPWYKLQPMGSSHPVGFNLLRIELASGDGRRLFPRLYFDGGNGFHIADSIMLPSPQDGIIDAIVRLPDAVRQLRLDPIAMPGPYTLGRIAMTEISRYEAAARALLKSRAFRPADSLADYLRWFLRLFRERGRQAALDHLDRSIYSARLTPNMWDYPKWVERYSTIGPGDRNAIRRRIETMHNPPKFSVLMPTYNTPEKWLRLAIESVINQLYPNWEMCIGDDASEGPSVRSILKEYAERDPRIKFTVRTTRGNISAATNSALAMASGDFIVLLDHDDEIVEHALYMTAEEIAAHPDVDLIYTDEGKKTEAGDVFDLHFKPDWNPDLFYSQNFFSHMGTYRTTLVREVGGFREGFEGSQDYDICLRCVARTKPERIRHIPHVLYYWRAATGSTASTEVAKPYTSDAAIRALTEHLRKANPRVSVSEGTMPTTYRVRYPVPDPAPSVSIIVPTKDNLSFLRRSMESIAEKTTYPNYSIIIVDNRTTDPDALAYLEPLSRGPRTTVVRYEHPFNYSAMNNLAAARAQGEVLVLLNNDIEIITPGWLEEMVSHAIRAGIGAVGAKLAYGDGSMQHCGIIVGLGGVAGHSHKHLRGDSSGYFHRVTLIQNVSAVTGACLAVRRELYWSVGGLDEVHLPIAFNDVDFCLRLREAGYRNLWTPFAEMFHHESSTRGPEDDIAKQARFLSEIRYMARRWGMRLLEDPHYSPSLTLDAENFAPAWPPRTRCPWL